MSAIVQNTLIAVACIILTIVIVAFAIARFQLLKLKREVQEDLVNTYTPEILGVKSRKDEADEQESEVEKQEADDSETQTNIK